MQVEAISDMAGLIVPIVYMSYTEEYPKEYIQRRYACLVSQMSRGLVYSEESERSSETPPGHISDLRIYELVVCEERDKRCVCFKARQGVAEAQVQELVRRLRMSIWLEEKGSRSVEEVMNAVFWKRAETTPRHEAWLAFFLRRERE